jgi:4'-phosphopantetheinyl transferase EntD
MYPQGMIERLLPPAIACYAATDDVPGATLFPDEAAFIAGAVESRRREFATARFCAREALARLGVPPEPIRRGAKHEPLWPEGTLGSITHCTGYRAAAVARRAEFVAVGIDAEPHAPMPAGVERRVLRAEEREWLTRAPPGTHWDRVIFSAKESVYKAWYPLTGRWLGFEEAVVTLDPQAGTFEARLFAHPAHGDLTKFSGRFLVEGGLVLTAIAAPRV